MRRYLDVCCLCRPWDDQSQPRIHVESEAVRIILGECEASQHTWIASAAVFEEASRCPVAELRERVLAMLARANEVVGLTSELMMAAQEFVDAGFPVVDSVHLASALAGRCDILLTTDDAFVRRAALMTRLGAMLVRNPAQ